MDRSLQDLGSLVAFLYTWSVRGLVMLAERLHQLEVRIREALAHLENLRAERASLEAKVVALERDLARGAADLKALAAERDQERSQRQLLEAEREETRARVEALLGELGHIEAAVRVGTA